MKHHTSLHDNKVTGSSNESGDTTASLKVSVQNEQSPCAASDYVVSTSPYVFLKTTIVTVCSESDANVLFD